MKNMQTVESDHISVSFSSFFESEEEFNRTLCSDKYQLLYITSGTGRYISEGVEFPLCSGSLFLSLPFEYRMVCVDKGIALSQYTVSFSENSLPESSRRLLARILDGDNGYYPPGTQHSAIASCFDRFDVTSTLSEEERGAYLEAVLSELIVLLSATARLPASHINDSISIRVSRYINSNLNRDLSLDTLSKLFFVNKYYLCRRFKEQNGTSIHNYINQKRVLYAKQLIESGETASRAAYKVGFGDYSAFYRAYTKFCGASPTGTLVKGVTFDGI